MPEPITIKFKLTEDEYTAAQMFYEKQNGHLILKIALVLTLMGIGIFRLTVTAKHEDYFFILIGLALLIIIIGRATIFARITYRQTPKFNDEYCMILSQDGIDFKTAVLDSKLNWALYNKVLENEKFFLLVYGRHTFTIIPKRAFANIPQEDAFRALVAEKIIG